VALDLTPGPAPLLADPVPIQQVIVNLLRNAFESLTDEPNASREVKLVTRPVPDGVEVAVQDAGSGIPPDELSRLFTTFYTSKPEGMGMGLAISKTIVEAHHGKIWATHNPHRGSTFHFVLPTGVGEEVTSPHKTRGAMQPKQP
jgi:signal transduction histidine kinase